jgi:hypothetical protein
MRAIQILCGVAVAIVLVFARASWGDGDGGVPDEPEDPIDELTEPITGEAVMPNPGDERPMRDPFTPYDIGGPEAAWRLQDLTPEEQAVAQRGIDANDQQVQDAYAELARAAGARAQSERAARELQLQQLGELGVVP